MSIIGYLIFIIVLAIGLIWIKIKLPYLIGRAGERFVRRKLLQLDKAHYKVLNDLLLPSTGNLSTTQIDHVVVSNYGIFCVETKDYKGWIFGNSNQEYWTQVIYYYKKRFYNPLLQNYAHVKAIETLIKPIYPKASVISFIAFPKADKLKISGTDVVGNAGDIINKIKSFTTPILSDVDKNKVFEILTNANILDKAARKSHNRGVQEIKNWH